MSPSQIVTDSPQVWWVFGRAGNNVGGCSNQGLITVGNWKPQPLLAVWLGAGITQFLLVMEMKTAWAWRVAAWAAAAWRAVIAPAPAADNLEKYAAALHTAPLLPALGWALTSSNLGYATALYRSQTHQSVSGQVWEMFIHTALILALQSSTGHI